MTRAFGLTGGIASGKSSVGRIFRGKGVPVIDADQVARDIVKKGTEGLAALVEAFGARILTADGELDRKALAEIAFSDEAERRKLNAVTHPRIAVETQRRIGTATEPWVCYEAALLVENGLADVFRPLVVVACSDELQVKRVLSRDGGTEAEAWARIRAQMPVAAKVAKADFVIWNERGEAELRDEAERVLDAILSGVSHDRRAP